MIRCSFLCNITLFILSLLIEQGVSVQIACYGCMCDDVLEYCEFMDRCCGSCEELCRVDYPDATCSGKCEAYLMQQMSTTTPQQVMMTSMAMRPNATISPPVHSRDSTIQPSAGALTAIFVSIGLLCLALGIPLVLYFKRCGSKTSDIEADRSVEKLPATIASDTATSTSDIPLLDEERERSYSDTHGSFPSGAQPNTQPNTQLAPVHTTPNNMEGSTIPPNNMEGSTIPPTTSMSQMNASDRIGGDQVNEGYSTLPGNPGHTTPSPEDSITSYTTSMSGLDGSGSIRRNQDTSTSDIPLLAAERERSNSDTHVPKREEGTSQVPKREEGISHELKREEGGNGNFASDRIRGDQDNEGYSTLPRNPGHTTPSPEDSTTSYTTSMSRLDGSGSIRRNQGEQISSSSYDPTNQKYPMNLKEDLYGQEPIPAPVHDTKWKPSALQLSNNFDSTSLPTLPSDISNN